MSGEKTELEVSLEAQIESIKKQHSICQGQADALSVRLTEVRRQLRDEWNRKSRDEIEQLKSLLAHRYSIDANSERFKTVFAIAWDRGHSGGCQEISNCFDEMAALL